MSFPLTSRGNKGSDGHDLILKERRTTSGAQEAVASITLVFVCQEVRTTDNGHTTPLLKRRCVEVVRIPYLLPSGRENR